MSFIDKIEEMKRDRSRYSTEPPKRVVDKEIERMRAMVMALWRNNPPKDVIEKADRKVMRSLKKPHIWVKK